LDMEKFHDSIYHPEYGLEAIVHATPLTLRMAASLLNKLVLGIRISCIATMSQYGAASLYKL
jgi:hypothetical protein